MTLWGIFAPGKEIPGAEKSVLGPWRPVVVFYCVALSLLALSRLGLSVWHWNRLEGTGSILKVLVYGLRMDLVVVGYLMALPVLLAPFFNGFSLTHRGWKRFLQAWFTLSLLFLIFMEAATPFFILEYDTRPNRLFVEYLEYPMEVFSMLITGYKFELALGALVVISTLFLGGRFFGGVVDFKSRWGIWRRILLLPVVGFLVFAGIRSSTGHRGVNPSNVAFTSDQLVNSLPLSSAYSMLYAVYRMGDEADAAKIYGAMDLERMFQIVEREALGESGGFKKGEIPSLRPLMPSVKRDKPLNLVIVLEESLGAEFVGRMGGLPLTPNLDALSKEGLFFDRLYATGTRSVRGIEAVLTGFLPTPARSVVKLGKSQSGFFTLASFLKSKGYTTRFVYGGEANFDNMRQFFLGNGFDEIIEEKDFKRWNFKGSWGVSDEDLFEKAHATLEADDPEKPSFTLIFSSSNHSPFEFPEGRINPYEEPKATVNNAVKYADYALGHFFKLAKKGRYWGRTLFLVVADHNSRVYGDALVPVDRFRIPALIIGPGIEPGVYGRLASQMDLPVTLLSLLGQTGEVPMLGRDLLNMPEGASGRAIMQFYQNQAYMEGERLLVLQPGEKREQFLYRENHLIPTPLDPVLAEKALAHAQWASWTYNRRLYKMN